jgi:hypothetical protein
MNIPFPLLVSITSVGDTATKVWFRRGQFFVNLLKSFRKYDKAQGRLRSQRYLCSNTAGHITDLHNFTVQKLCGNQTGQLVFSGSKQDRYEILRIPRPCNYLSFWLMQVPREVVPDHSNIFTEEFENMLSQFLEWSASSVEATRIECQSSEQGRI